MEKLFRLEYEKMVHLDDTVATGAMSDAEKENDLIIEKSLECMDLLSDTINSIENIRIASNSIDYENTKIKGNSFVAKGHAELFVDSEDTMKSLERALDEKSFISAYIKLASM